MTLGLLAFTILAFCVLLDRRDKRTHEERLERGKRADDERTAHRLEVVALLQRIQAPELAVLEHQQANAQEPDSFPLTDEQLAERQEAAAFIQRLEQFENQNAGILP